MKTQGPDSAAVSVRCPVCGKPADPRLHPFCGRRCADVDLGRWFTGQYRVPGPAIEPDADDEKGGKPA